MEIFEDSGQRVKAILLLGTQSGDNRVTATLECLKGPKNTGTRMIMRKSQEREFPLDEKKPEDRPPHPDGVCIVYVDLDHRKRSLDTTGKGALTPPAKEPLISYKYSESRYSYG